MNYTNNNRTPTSLFPSKKIPLHQYLVVRVERGSKESTEFLAC